MMTNNKILPKSWVQKIAPEKLVQLIKSAVHFGHSVNCWNPKMFPYIYAEKNGFSPGKDIFIHGGPRNFLKHFFFDWTEGCIAVTNSEIEEIYNLVNENTPIFIKS